MGTDLLTKRPRGAPAWEYDPEIAEEICIRIASSSQSIITILASEKGFPGLSTVTKWLNSNADFSNAYARAKQFQADLLGEDILDIADSAELEAHDKRIRIDARRWLMSKLKPKVYGDKLDVTSGGEPLPAVSPVQIDARVQTIMLLASERQRLAEEARSLLEE
jgi:hypothetical protein